MRAFRALFSCCTSRGGERRAEEEEEIIMARRKNKDGPILDMIRDVIDVDSEQNAEKVALQNKKTNEDAETDVQTKNLDTDFIVNVNEQILFEERLIRDDEKPYLKFTKMSLLEFIDSIMKLEDYDLLYNQNRLLLHYRKNGSVLSKDLFLAKSIFTLPKNQLKRAINIEEIARLLYNPECRLKWDKGLKQLVKLEGGEESYVIRSWMHSPMFMVSEREVIDKRIEFYHEGNYYCVSTSVPDDYIPEEPSVVRAMTYFNSVMVSNDEENFYFTSVNQVDFKINLPQNMLNAALPAKILSWYKLLIEHINKREI